MPSAGEHLKFIVQPERLPNFIKELSWFYKEPFWFFQFPEILEGFLNLQKRFCIMFEEVFFAILTQPLIVLLKTYIVYYIL